MSDIGSVLVPCGARGGHLEAGLAQLRQLVAQRAFADAKLRRGLRPAAAAGAQRAQDQLRLAAAQVAVQIADRGRLVGKAPPARRPSMPARRPGARPRWRRRRPGSARAGSCCPVRARCPARRSRPARWRRHRPAPAPASGAASGAPAGGGPAAGCPPAARAAAGCAAGTRPGGSRGLRESARRRLRRRRSRLLVASTRTSSAIGLLAAQALDLALLQHAQQLGLQAERHLGDLVQQQRAAVRLLELAGVGAGGAGEGALLVAEQRRLEHVLGNRGAVDGHERPTAGAANAGGCSAPAPPCRCPTRRSAAR